MNDLPFFKFFPADWLADEKLRLCSRAARGLWMDLLCLAWKAKRRGYLENAEGAPLTTEQLARVVGCTPREVARDLAELESAGVFSREPSTNVIFSRRMVRDAAFRQACSAAGSRGGGNPMLKKVRDQPLNLPLDIPLKVPPNDGLKPQSVRGSEGQKVRESINHSASHSASPTVTEEPSLDPLLLETTVAHSRPHWSTASGWQGITQEDRERWKLAYPACDLERQLAQMDVWLRANPTEAKKSNWARFITGWMKNEQDKGGDARADRRMTAPTASTNGVNRYQSKAPTAEEHGKGFFGPN